MRVKCWSEIDDWQEILHDGRRFVLDGDDVLTDETGAFALRGLSPGPHTVFPELTEHPELKSQPGEIKGVQPECFPLEFRLAGSARLRGVVVDATTGAALPSFAIAGRAFDAPDGRFAVEVGEGPEVEFSAAGYESARVPVESVGGDAGERRVALVATPNSGTLVIAVTGEGGEPVEGLFVHVVTPDFRSWVRTFPGPGSEFLFGRVPAGDITVFLRSEGSTPATVKATVPEHGEARVEAQFRRCGSARVRLLDSAGNVLRYPQSVVLRDAEGKGPPVRWVYTRPQGTLFTVTEMQWGGGEDGTELNLFEADGRLTGIVPGTYRLVVGDGTRTQEAQFTVGGGQEVDVTVRMPK
jgi:hypothetical protein